ncbi:MAG: competence protein ComFC [Bacteroidota bacterium]|jgi:orotate phosphoribosyltransferase-like protein
MKIKDKIKKLLQEHGELSVKEITDWLQVSKQAVHIAINQLLENGEVFKLGKVPKTIYRLNNKQTPSATISTATADEIAFLQKQFLLITEMGEMKESIEGFTIWCRQRKLPLEKTIAEFITTKKKYEPYYCDGIIDGTDKLTNTKGYEKIFLDKVYYLDFYAIERFGKTRLGTLLHYAKQGQNKMLMGKIVEEIKPAMKNLLKKEKFEAVGFVPPTIRREVQIMKYLETHLKVNLPVVKLQKISGIIPVPQKSLSKLEERITNAENTFAVSQTVKYNHVLLIDDAVGSGSTLNQIAGKLKQKGIAKKVTGLAVVGSFKGFDVVTDV